MIRVYTSGTFDLFHYGHLNILLECKKLGHLTVGVSTDELVESYKGLKPIMNYTDRLSIIKELRCVDEVIKQETFFDVRQLRNIDIIVLGDDWYDKPFPELDVALKTLKIEMRYIPYTERLSTSKIKKYIIDNSDSIIMNLENRGTQN